MLNRELASTHNPHFCVLTCVLKWTIDCCHSAVGSSGHRTFCKTRAACLRAAFATQPWGTLPVAEQLVSVHLLLS